MQLHMWIRIMNNRYKGYKGFKFIKYKRGTLVCLKSKNQST